MAGGWEDASVGRLQWGRHLAQESRVPSTHASGAAAGEAGVPRPSGLEPASELHPIGAPALPLFTRGSELGVSRSNQL